jgi:hypothetical protein
MYGTCRVDPTSGGGPEYKLPKTNKNTPDAYWPVIQQYSITARVTRSTPRVKSAVTRSDVEGREDHIERNDDSSGSRCLGESGGVEELPAVRGLLKDA